MGSSKVIPGLCLLLLSPLVVTAQFFGHYQYGQQLGCKWGTKAAAMPGQCQTFQCLSQWFLGSTYLGQCPYGTLFSLSAGHCVSPLSLAAQCSSVTAAGGQGARLWSWY